jgi:hypothetical protein
LGLYYDISRHTSFKTRRFSRISDVGQKEETKIQTNKRKNDRNKKQRKNKNIKGERKEVKMTKCKIEGRKVGKEKKMEKFLAELEVL